MEGPFLHFRLLGAVEAFHCGMSLPLGHARQRSVLAVLLLSANEPVSTDALIERVWGPSPPVGASSTLYSYLARLRKALAALGPVAPVLERGALGYVITVDDEHVDERVARRCIAAARAAHDLPTAAALHAHARALWHPQPLAGLDSPYLAQARLELDDLRSAALVHEQTILEQLGRADELLPDLARLAEMRPLDESVARAVIRTLMNAGRGAEALAHFETLRLRLREELGILPDAQTALLHTELLGSSQHEADTGKMPAALAASRRHPAQLPSAARGFAGRAHQIDLITSLVTATSSDMPGHDERPHPLTQAPATSPRILIHGPAGVGKTALALTCAHRLLGQYGDGQLFVNLSGHHKDHLPLDPSSVLVRCIRAFGVSESEIPHDQDEQAALYRSLLFKRRVLVMLDDATAVEQILPLIPGGHGSALFVTSRHRLPGLAEHGFHRVSLDPLPVDQALEVLRPIIGPHRIDQEAAAARRLCTLGGGLPLALRLIAARAADRPEQTLQELSEHLHTGRTLAELTSEPGSGSPVESAFDLSYRTLSAHHRELFRKLASLPVAEFAGATATAALGEPAHTVSHTLARLRSVHLIEEHRADRYRFHDLVRLYGQERAAREDDAEVLDELLARLLAYYRGNVLAANAHHRLHLLRPPGHDTADTEDARRPPAGSTHTATDPTVSADPRTLSRWLEAEHTNILHAIKAAADRPSPDLRRSAWRLTEAMRGFFRLRPHDPAWHDAAQAGLQAAQSVGDLAATAALHLALADIGQARSDDKAALFHDQQAFEAARIARWAEGQAAAASGIGRAHWSLGNLDEATEALTTALELYRTTGSVAGVAASTGSLGRIHHDRGRWTQTLAAYRQSLAFSRRVGSLSGQALNLYYLASLRAETGSTSIALSHLRAAQRLSRTSGMHQGEVMTAAYLAYLTSLPGPFQDLAYARASLRQAQDLTDRVSDRRIVAESLIHIGNARRTLNDLAHALETHTAALAAARGAHYLRGEISALIALAHDFDADHRIGEALHAAESATAKAGDARLPLHVLRARLARVSIEFSHEPTEQHAENLQSAIDACRHAHLTADADIAERSLTFAPRSRRG